MMSEGVTGRHLDVVRGHDVGNPVALPADNAACAVTGFGQSVNRGAQVVDHVAARGPVVTVGGVAIPAGPIRMVAADGRTMATSDVAPTLAGSDTDAVLAAAGFTSAEMSALRGADLI